MLIYRSDSGLSVYREGHEYRVTIPRIHSTAFVSVREMQELVGAVAQDLVTLGASELLTLFRGFPRD